MSVSARLYGSDKMSSYPIGREDVRLLGGLGFGFGDGASLLALGQRSILVGMRHRALEWGSE